MIIVDTNIIISALYSQKGASFKIFNYCLNDKIRFAISPLVFMEYIVKVSEKINNGFITISMNDFIVLLKRFLENSEIITQPILQRPTLPDVGDDKILECAISANTDYIITFNIKDFPKRIISKYGIKVLRPKEYLKKAGLI